jgi:hypothetical protein
VVRTDVYSRSLDGVSLAERQNNKLLDCRWNCKYFSKDWHTNFKAVGKRQGDAEGKAQKTADAIRQLL